MKQVLGAVFVLLAEWSNAAASSVVPSRAECAARFGNVTLLPDDLWPQRGMPVLLLSFPGSGNTYLRLLIEFATGFLSSTIYWDHDKELQQVFKAEEKCGLRQIVIKAHPEDMMFRGFMDSKGVEIRGPTALRTTNKKSRRKCDRSFVNHWDKVLLLTRDPYKAIVSDYQRLVTSSHNGEYSPQLQDQSRIKIKGNREMSANDFWLSVAQTKAEAVDAKMNDVIWPILRHSNPDYQQGKSPLPYHHPTLNVSMGVVRYEQLISPSAQEREMALSAVVRMLNVTSSPLRIACAFVLADDPRIRRAAKKLNSTFLFTGVQANLTKVLWSSLKGFAGNFSYSLPSF